MSLKLALSALVATLALSSAAAAQEEQFTISNAQGGVLESFDLNASSGDYYGSILQFNISNDNLNNNRVSFIYTDANAINNNTLVSFGNTGYNIYNDSANIYSGGPTLNVTPGNTYQIGNGDSLAVSAVSTVPEPSAWALTIVGLAMAGAMLRRQRRRQTAAVGLQS